MQRGRPPSAPSLVHKLLRDRLVSGTVLVLGDAATARALVRRGFRVSERLMRAEATGRDPFGVRIAEPHATVIDIGWWPTLREVDRLHYLRELHAVTAADGFLHIAVPPAEVPGLLAAGPAEWGLVTVHDGRRPQVPACGGRDLVLVSLHRRPRNPAPALEPVRSFRDAKALERRDFDAGA